MTTIRAFCNICHGDLKEVTDMTIINGTITMKLECGHELKEKFVFL